MDLEHQIATVNEAAEGQREEKLVAAEALEAPSLFVTFSGEALYWETLAPDYGLDLGGPV